MGKKRKRKNWNKDRVPRTPAQLIAALDAQLFFLREHLRGLNESLDHLKIISGILRTLICWSSGTEGLLWRLVDELGVDDRVDLQFAGGFNPDHPLAKDLKFAFAPIQRGGKGDPRLPRDMYPLKFVIKDTVALLIRSKPITHENLIKMISEQEGVHEDDGLDQALIDMKSILIQGVQPFVPVLCIDSELTLEIGEHILSKAESVLNYKRKNHKHHYGDVSIVLRLHMKQQLAGRIPLMVFHSYVSDVDIIGTANPTSIVFILKKHGKPIGEIQSPYPKNWRLGDNIVFVFSYCSRTQQARTIANGKAHDIAGFGGLGWVHASDLKVEHVNKDYVDFVEKHFLYTYERLLSTENSQTFHELLQDGSPPQDFVDGLKQNGVFPD